MFLKVFEELLEGEKVWTDWQWLEPNYPYSMWELSELRFTRFVGHNVYAVDKRTGEKRWLYFQSWTEFRRVPTTAPIDEER